MRIGQSDYPIEYLVGLVLAVIIVYAGQIPAPYVAFVDSVGGRLVGIVGVLAVLRYFGWIYGVLAALAFMVLMRGAVVAGEEGFTGQRPGEGFTNQIVKERIGGRWYVERVLGEQPEVIDTDVVSTAAVTDNSQRSMGGL